MKIEYVDGELIKKLFMGAAASLEKNKQSINDLNVFPVPDGDTGTNMSLTVQSAVKQIKSLNSNNINDIAKAMSNGTLMGARGNSGVILSQLFRGFANGLKNKNKLDTKIIANAFKLGSDTAYKAVMKPTEGTILTIARECSEKALEVSNYETDMIVFLEKVIKHGEIILKKTPEMLDVLKKAGVVDAGGKGLLIILKGALEALTGGENYFFEDIDDIENEMTVVQNHDLEDITFGYCTEFIINNTDSNVDDIRNEFLKAGDSLLVVGSDNIIKVHVHTNNPGDVLMKALAHGELIDIKIDNMKYQHRSKVISDASADEIIETSQKKYGFITVAMGEGIKNVFRDLNADYVITGGQTMNPSTEDILKAVNQITAKNIIILPNNSNIVLAANQAKELSDKNIYVVPTKTIPQGISALLVFDEDLDIDDNINEMNSVIEDVKTGEVTFAVRDTEINNKKINKDDIMGICDGEILTVGNDINEVSFELIKNTATDENELITIFYGEDIEEEKANQLAKKLEAELKDFDIAIIYGGQPLYYYIFSIE